MILTKIGMAKRIIKLDEAVINRIAAGEIINRPENVVKELIENSLDAGSTQVSVLVKDGGLKQLVITDNGTGKGIQKSDFPLVCQRFCTSKLKEFSDLKAIQSYGFRGEALASVSHVAHVSVISRTSDSACAFKGVYSDGVLVNPGAGTSKSKSDRVDPKPIAGNIGTQIFVEDLFYNIPIRKAAFKNVQEEYNRILGVVQKYSVLNASVSFSCRKAGSNKSDLQTPINATQLDNIRNIYGDGIAAELLKFDHESPPNSSTFSFKASGFLSNPNFSIKKKEFIIFINNRLVECPSIRKSLDAVYAKYLPKTAAYSFIFLSVFIPPASIDVNVHPTKKHVHFLHEDEITLSIADAVDTVLTSADQSRVFSVPRPISFVQNSIPYPSTQSSTSSHATTESVRGPIAPVKTKAHLLVRTDSKTRTLESFYLEPSGVNLSRSFSDKSGVYSTLDHVTKKPRTEEVGNTVDDFISDKGDHSQDVVNNVEFVDCKEVLDYTNTIDSATEEFGDEVVDEIVDETEGSSGVNDPVEFAVGHNSDDEIVVKEIQSQQPPSLLVDATKGAHTSKIISFVDDSVFDNSGNKDTYPTVDEVEELIVGEEIVNRRPFVTVELDSIIALRQELDKRQCQVATSILKDHTFVGCFDTHLALIQHNTRLLVVEVAWISRDFMYQIVLYGFSNFGLIPVEPGLDLVELILLGLDQRADEWKATLEQMVVGGDADEKSAVHVLARKVADAIIEMRLMLEEYFSIIVDENGLLTGLPNLIPGYLPNPAKLPVFILNLGGSVDFSSEKECFEGVAGVLAHFYAFTGPSPDQSQEEYYHQVQHYLFTELRNCIGLRSWTDTEVKLDGTRSSALSRPPCIREAANLHELYKIFERC